MTEHQRQAPDRPEAERYYAQYAELGVGPGGSHERRGGKIVPYVYGLIGFAVTVVLALIALQLLQ